MARSIRLSDRCLLDKRGQVSGILSTLLVDGTIPFTGLRGLAWRLMGVTRSGKNPNICTL